MTMILTIDKKSVHDGIWEKEIDMLETFVETINKFANCPHLLWDVLVPFDPDWKKLFTCQITKRLNALCRCQLRYLATLSKCLDNDLFRIHMKRLNLTDSFTGPLMAHVMQANFNQEKTIHDWDEGSKLAFTVVYRMNANSLDGSNLHVDLVKMNDLSGKLIGEEWAKNRMKNLRELRHSFQTFCELDQDQTSSKIGNLPDECDDCQPFDIDTIIARRLKRTHCIFKLSPRFEIEFLEMMRPFTLNLCTPPIEEDSVWLLDLTALNNMMCPFKMSRRLMHDEQVIKQWSRHFIQYHHTRANRGVAPILGCLQSLLAIFDLTMFPERLAWFIGAYKEMYKNDLKHGILKNFLVDDELDLFDNMQMSAFFLALLQLGDVFDEQDHHDIIQSAVCQQIETPISAEKDDMRIPVALFMLTLSKDWCLEFIKMHLSDDEPFMAEWYFSIPRMEEYVFRYFDPKTPENLLRAAIMTAEVALLYLGTERAVIRVKTSGLLKKLIKSGSHVEICSQALKKLEMKNPKKKRR